MAKRRVINMETGEEIEDESPETVLISRPGVKRVKRVKRVKQVKPVKASSKVDPSLSPTGDPALKSEPEFESQPELKPDLGPTLVEEMAIEVPQLTFEQVKIVCLRQSLRNEVGRVREQVHL